MATITQLKSATGEAVIVQAGESSDIVATFKDMDGAAIVKANLVSLTATLYDVESDTVINSRDDQNVLDANNGTVATDGTLTLKLGPTDNAIINSRTRVGFTEQHVLLFKWTWNDGVLRTGRSSALGIQVEKLADPE